MACVPVMVAELFQEVLVSKKSIGVVVTVFTVICRCFYKLFALSTGNCDGTSFEAEHQRRRNEDASLEKWHDLQTFSLGSWGKSGRRHRKSIALDNSKT